MEKNIEFRKSIQYLHENIIMKGQDTIEKTRKNLLDKEYEKVFFASIFLHISLAITIISSLFIIIKFDFLNSFFTKISINPIILMSVPIFIKIGSIVYKIIRELNLKFDGIYQVEIAEGETISLNGHKYVSNQTVFLKSGTYHLISSNAFRLYLIPEHILQVADARYKIERPFFSDVYTY